MDRSRDRILHTAALVLCGAMLTTLPWTWVTVISSPWLFGDGPTTYRDESGLSLDLGPLTILALGLVAGLHGLSLARPAMAPWKRGLALGGAGLVASIGILITTLEARFALFVEIERHAAIQGFDLLWLGLLLLHLWVLLRFLWWLATGPPRTRPQEVASAIGLGLPLAGALGGGAAAIEDAWPGALSGGGALLVPVPLAIGLSAAAAGFGLALWFRLRRARPVEGEAAA